MKTYLSIKHLNGIFLINSNFKIIMYDKNTFPATRIAFQSNFVSSTSFASKYGPRSLANLISVTSESSFGVDVNETNAVLVFISKR